MARNRNIPTFRAPTLRGFPFVLIVEHTDDGTFERIEGTEPGRHRLDTARTPIPAVQIEPHRPEVARWGCDHGHHNDSINGVRVPLRAPRFAYGGCWYDDLDAWTAAWRATITRRVPCDRSGTAS